MSLVRTVIEPMVLPRVRGTVFGDSFDAGRKDWVVEAGSWSVSNGVLTSLAGGRIRYPWRPGGGFEMEASLSVPGSSCHIAWLTVAGNGYSALFRQDLSNITLFRYDAFVTTSLGTGAWPPGTEAFTPFGLRKTGSVLQGMVNGTPVVQVTDATYGVQNDADLVIPTNAATTVRWVRGRAL